MDVVVVKGAKVCVIVLVVVDGNGAGDPEAEAEGAVDSVVVAGVCMAVVLVVLPVFFGDGIAGVGETEVSIIKPAVFGMLSFCFATGENKNKPLRAASQEKRIITDLFMSF